MTNDTTGGCLCGAVRFAITSEPRVHYCHCGMCRRATGSAFAVFAWLPRPALHWLGAIPRTYRSSPIASRGFCGNCGAAITLDYDGSDEIALHVGCFDAPGRLAPAYHYGVEGRLGWVDIARHLPASRTKQRW
ncbi:MAG: hypothetical protein JWO51_813 [Rhodospirillales bacterium]|nr:hypothetical protein [Rhodospirillales bacterium]